MKYLIHNGTRSRTNRTLRATMPEHGGYKQYVLGHRLVSGRPIPITEETLKDNLSELREKESFGLVYVTDLHFAPVDLTTLSVGPLPAESPLPNPPLDSAKNDIPAGMRVDVRGDAPPPAEFTMPVGAPPAAFTYAPEVEEVPEKVVEAPVTKSSRRGR